MTNFSFLEKITSWACLLESGLKLIFHWEAHYFILERSLLSSKVVITESWITEKREVSSAKSLVLEDKPSAKSLIYIKNNNGPRMEQSVYDKYYPYTIAENQKYTHRKKIIVKYRIKKSLLKIQTINWMKIDENFHKK